MCLPIGICVIGDAAYCPSEHLVPVYQGLAQADPRYDNFNYYASQLRIRSKMAFGIMNIKWGILNHPINVSIRNLRWLIQAIGLLHNNCITNERLERERETDNEADMGFDPNIPQYIPTVPHDERGDPIDLGELLKITMQGHSHLR